VKFYLLQRLEGDAVVERRLFETRALAKKSLSYIPGTWDTDSESGSEAFLAADGTAYYQLHALPLVCGWTQIKLSPFHRTAFLVRAPGLSPFMASDMEIDFIRVFHERGRTRLMVDEIVRERFKVHESDLG